MDTATDWANRLRLDLVLKVLDFSYEFFVLNTMRTERRITGLFEQSLFRGEMIFGVVEKLADNLLDHVPACR